MVDMSATQGGLLDTEDSVLVVVDIQQRLTAAMPEDVARPMIVNSVKLLSAAELLGVPVLLTEQYPKGLGATVDDVLQKLPQASQCFEKTGFSCCAADDFNLALNAVRRKQVVLLGQETHVCVLQTAFDLLQTGYKVFVVDDAVCSRRGEHKQSALQRMQHSGIRNVCHESVLFEWLRDANHPQFKAISALVR